MKPHGQSCLDRFADDKDDRLFVRFANLIDDFDQPIDPRGRVGVPWNARFRQCRWVTADIPKALYRFGNTTLLRAVRFKRSILCNSGAVPKDVDPTSLSDT